MKRLCEYCEERIGETNSKFWDLDDERIGGWVCTPCEEQFEHEHADTCEEIAAHYDQSGNWCEFCGVVTDSSYTASIPPHHDVYCCDRCLPYEKQRFDGFR